MVTIQATSNVYGVKHFIVDTKDDFKLLRRDLLFMGSTAFVISTGETYIVDGNRNWVLKSGSGSSAGDDSEGDSGDDTFDTIVYDGGEIL